MVVILTLIEILAFFCAEKRIVLTVDVHLEQVQFFSFIDLHIQDPLHFLLDHFLIGLNVEAVSFEKLNRRDKDQLASMLRPLFRSVQCST